MKGLQPDVNLAPLIGKTVEQIRFSKWGLQILLDGDYKIVVEGLLCIRNDSSSLEIDNYIAHATEICAIAGSRILGAERTQDGGMELRMSSGVDVFVRNSESQYESFQIHIDDSVIVA
jgi:hypothetical protein